MHTDSSLVECLTPGETLTGSVARGFVESPSRSPAIPQSEEVVTCAVELGQAPQYCIQWPAGGGRPGLTASGVKQITLSSDSDGKEGDKHQGVGFFFFIVFNIYLLSSLCASF